MIAEYFGETIGAKHSVKEEFISCELKPRVFHFSLNAIRNYSFSFD